MSFGAATFIFDADGRVLLIKEDYGERRWSLPGGTVEPGESPIDAAVREALEEIGCEVRLSGLVGIALFRWGPLTTTAFVGEIVSGEPHPAAPGEIAEVAWFNPDEVPAPRSNTLRVFLGPAARGERGLVVVEDAKP